MGRKVSILVGILISFNGFGQRGLELGGWIGVSEYFGDLQTELQITDLSLAGGLVARFNFDERISAKAAISYLGLRGNDADSPNSFERNRNLNFFSTNFDLTTQAEFNFLTYKHGSKEEYFTPYLFAGLSVLAFNPRTTINNQTVNLRDFGTEGQPIGSEYGRFTLAPMYGIGLKWDINYDWSINIELNIHHAASDYIDDVSSVFPDLQELSIVRGRTAVSLSDRSLVTGIGETGRQRGNSSNNDTYVMLGVSVMKYFGTLDCPKFLKN